MQSYCTELKKARAMIRKVCILDYGSGNVASVRNSFQRLDIETVVSNEPTDILHSSHLVLPGVGAFKASMDKINAKLPLKEIYSQISLGKPFLGICVGTQALAETGFEFGSYPGLGLFPGSEVIELPVDVPRPHVGWNSIEVLVNHPILSGIENGADFYFVHSYFISKIEESNFIAQCDYGIKFPAIVAKDNLIGVQFHPEKSQNNGDRVLKNFVELIK